MGKQPDEPEVSVVTVSTSATEGGAVAVNTRERFYAEYEAALDRQEYVDALKLLEERFSFDARQLLCREGVQLPWLLHDQGRDRPQASLAATAHAAIRVLKRKEVSGEADAVRASKIRAAADAMLSVHQFAELRRQVSGGAGVNPKELARLILVSANMVEANLIMGVVDAGWIATLEDHARRVDKQSRAGRDTRDNKRKFKNRVLAYAKTLPSALNKEAMAERIEAQFGRKPKRSTLVKWLQAARKSGELPPARTCADKG